MQHKLLSLARTLGLTFTNLDLIENAFVHRSYLNESTRFRDSNERLEFLGDAVLELATSAFLFNKYPNFQEGMLTNLRASLVRTESLADLAKLLHLDQHLLMSKGEEATGGRSNISILANTTESFLGAIYLDQGYQACTTILEKYLFPKITDIVAQASYKDNKSTMQEIAQSRFKATPRYEVLSAEGPDHNKLFTVVAMIGDQPYGTGQGKSKQEAQEAAAKSTLEMLKKD